MTRRVRIEALEVPDGFTHLFEGAPFTGVAVAHSEEGWLEEELSFSHGIQTGPMRRFDRSGQLVEEEHQLGGVPHGLRRQWHATGALAVQEVYELGVCLEATSWDASGKEVGRFPLAPDDPLWSRVAQHRRILSGADS
jgi:antitoxin component YwqK of YwqJK toxin-antitoxin module